MATAGGWAYYYKIRTCGDHMDTLKLYKDYKECWDRHRIPGETKLNEVLWEDPWWKIHNPLRKPRKLPPLHGGRESKIKSVPSKNTLAPITTKKESRMSKKESASHKASPNNLSDSEDEETSPAVKLAEKPPIVFPNVSIDSKRPDSSSSISSLESLN